MMLEFLKKIDFKALDICIKEDSDNPLHYKLLKLSEEVGELSSLWLAYKACSNRSKSSLDQLQSKGGFAIMEEALDVLLVILDIIVNLKKELGISDEEIIKIFNSKTDKWLRKLQTSRISRRV